MAKTPEESEFTGAKDRMDDLADRESKSMDTHGWEQLQLDPLGHVARSGVDVRAIFSAFVAYRCVGTLSCVRCLQHRFLLQCDQPAVAY